MPNLFGLWTHKFKKMYLITKKIESPDIQVKLTNSQSKSNQYSHSRYWKELYAKLHNE